MLLHKLLASAFLCVEMVDAGFPEENFAGLGDLDPLCV